MYIKFSKKKISLRNQLYLIIWFPVGFKQVKQEGVNIITS